VHSSGRTSRRAVRRTALAVAALLLTGCTQNAPGVAAQVGHDAVTDEQVDQLAEALCILSAGSTQGAPPPTGQQIRRQALQILIDNQLAGDVIDPGSVDPAQVAAAKQRAAQSRAALPERLRGSFDDAVEGFATLQVGLTVLGQKSLLAAGKKADQQASLAEGQRLLQQYAAKAGVTVDPRFGTLTDGQLQPADGSLSVAVSDQAKASSAGNAVGSDLPANLSCSAG
jgi:hypothetical protein